MYQSSKIYYKLSEYLLNKGIAQKVVRWEIPRLTAPYKYLLALKWSASKVNGKKELIREVSEIHEGNHLYSSLLS